MSITATIPPARSKELMRQTQSELAELFESLPIPGPASIDGNWRGALMAIIGLGWLPRGIASGLYRALATPVDPWRGKSFNQGRGANHLFSFPGVALGRYRYETITSPVDGKPSVWLDYNVPENLAILRSIRGEARQLTDTVLLGRMNWQGKNALHRVLFFTLTRVS